MTDRATAPRPASATITKPWTATDRVEISWAPSSPTTCTHKHVEPGTRFIEVHAGDLPPQRNEAPALRCATCGTMFGPDVPSQFRAPEGHRPISIRYRAGFAPDRPEPKPQPWWRRTWARITGRAER